MVRFSMRVGRLEKKWFDAKKYTFAGTENEFLTTVKRIPHINQKVGEFDTTKIDVEQFFTKSLISLVNNNNNNKIEKPFKKGRKVERKKELVNLSRVLEPFARQHSFNFITSCICYNGLLFSPDSPIIALQDESLQPVLIIARVNDEQFGRYFDESSFHGNASTQFVETKNKLTRQLQKIFGSWWNMLIYCCVEYLKCRFLCFLSDSGKVLYLEVVKFRHMSLVGYCHTQYHVEYLKYLIKYIISSNTCNEVLPLQVNSSNDNNNECKKEEIDVAIDEFNIIWARMKHHPRRDFDFTLLLKLQNKKNLKKHYGKCYLDFCSKKRNEAAIKLISMEFECIENAKNDDKLSVFVPNYVKLTKMNTMIKKEKHSADEKNIFDLSECMVLITSDCGLAITKIAHFTDRERDCIVTYLRNIVSEMKCDKNLKHGEIDAKHILINDRKELKLIDFDPTPMHLSKLNYQVDKNVNIGFSYVSSILKKITFAKDKSFCDDEFNDQEIAMIDSAPESTYYDSDG